jgi:glycosyltransferase involved in cell wall biosynthesis
MKKEILCSISTKGRYDTTLPMAISSVITQTLKPDYIIIQDDNDQPIDVREIQHYNYLMQMLSESGIAWEWLYAEKKGQHHNHQRANHMGFKWVWRLDDDTIADSNVLQTLYLHANENENVGAVGGSVLTPPSMGEVNATGKIEDIYSEPNLQWGRIKQKKEVDHLHCSFLYRAGVADYCLSLSRIAHREETLFTYELIKKGYKNYVVPEAITWHLKNKVGGIRDGVHEMFEHDERIFQNIMNFKDQTIVILDCGMGDHIVFKKILPYIKNPVLFTCYPEIIPGRSIAEAQALFGDIHDYNVYAHMDRWNWTGSLEDAFKKFYNVI